LELKPIGIQETVDTASIGIQETVDTASIGIQETVDTVSIGIQETVDTVPASWNQEPARTKDWGQGHQEPTTCKVF
jgi:hypothetical protein